MKFYIIFASFISIFAIADQCKTTNLYDLKDNPENSFPIIDQLRIGNCYSIAASHLVEYYLKSKNLNIELDPLWNAYIYKTQNKFQKVSSGIGSGYIPDMLSTIRKLGICSNSELQNKYSLLKNGNAISNEELIQYYQKLWRAFQFRRILRPHQSDNVIFQDVSDKLYNSERYSKLLKNKLSEKFTLITAFKNKHPNDLFVEDIMDGCTEKLKVEFPEEKSVWIQNQSDLEIRNYIEDVIAGSNPRPVAISYCNAIWNQQKGVQILKRPYRFYSQAITFLNCFAHYSIVVGMQDMENECHYLVRNSYGEKYSSPYRKCYVEYEDKSRETIEISKVKSQTYKVLGCWFNEEDLFNNLATITWLKDN